MTTKTEDGIEKVDLTNEAALVLSLSAERVQSAQTLLQLRQSEMQATITSLSTEYAEDGKYKVTGIDMEKRQIIRTLRVPAATAPAATA